MFRGWVRLPGSPWRPVVKAPTEDAAWTLLRQHVDQLGAKLADLYVGPSEVDPRIRRRTAPTAPQRTP